MLVQDFHPIIHYLRQHPYLGELFAFLVAFAESLPLLGTVIPGTVTMTVVGILIGTSALAGFTTVAITAFAALAGDTIGFVVGYYYNDRLRNIWPFKKYPKWLTLAEDFFHKHGGKSIFIGRFVGPARSTIPLVAGLLKVTWGRFFVAAIPSAILWAIAYLFPGILIGALSQEVPKGETTKFLLYGLAIIAIIWLIFWLIQHFFIQLARAINWITDQLWQFLTQKKFYRRFIQLIQNPNDLNDHHQLTLCLGALITGLLFLVLLCNVMSQGILTQANEPIFHLFQSMHLPSLKPWFVCISILFGPMTLLLATAIISLGFFITKQWRYAFHLLGSVFLSAGAIFIFKHLSHSIRPQGFQIVAHSSSFPSGHTGLATVIFGLLAYMTNEKIANRWRFIPYTLAILIALSTGISRLYLGAHWFTDVIGSYLLAATVTFISITSLRRTANQSRIHATPIWKFALVVSIGFIISWPLNLIKNYHHDLFRYTKSWPKKVISINEWWHNPTSVTPTYRNNRLGHPFQPFNLQWEGKLPEIKASLEKNGWEITAKHKQLKTALQRFATKNARYHMPLLPWLYQDKPAAIVAIKHIENQKVILELRIWQSHIYFHNAHSPLWLGSVNYRIPPTQLFSYKKRAKVSMEIGQAINSLFHFNHAFQLKLIKVNVQDSHIKWAGNILLVRHTQQEKPNLSATKQTLVMLL